MCDQVIRLIDGKYMGNGRKMGSEEYATEYLFFQS